MNPTEKVITDPQAKKIAKLLEKKGIKLPESQWYWKPKDKYLIPIQELPASVIRERFNMTYYPAYDTSEMMEIIWKDEDSGYPLDDLCKTSSEYWSVTLYRNESKERKVECKTLAEALGELLIYLIENDKLKWQRK